MFHAVLQWVDSKLFPHLNLDLGLRNSIRTSLGYLGFLVAAGFGLQSIVNNFVSGLILLWERAVRVGDWIVVGADQGFVRRINVRSGVITNLVRKRPHGPGGDPSHGRGVRRSGESSRSFDCDR